MELAREIASTLDHERLRSLVTEDAVRDLLGRASEPYDEETSPLLQDALGRVASMFVESARRDFRPAVIKKGNVVAPASGGVLDSRYESVVLAELGVARLRMQNCCADSSPQSALNTAIRAFGRCPTAAIGDAALALFTLHGEQTAELLSLVEAFFCFPSTAELPAPAAALHQKLVTLGRDRGWTGPA